MNERTIPLYGFLILLTLTGCVGGPQTWLFDRTGEEELPGQLRGVVDLANSSLRPSPQAGDGGPIAHTGLNPFGINTFLNQEVEVAKRERSVQMIAAAGFHWLRQEFPWEDIEIHGKGDFEDRRHEPWRSAWDKYDNIVDLAGQYGLEVVPRLSNPPAWTRALTDTIGTNAPPDDYEDYGDFVYAVVSRYRGRIRYYQLWNEPNVYPEWGEQPVDPEAYTRLLCTGYRRAKEADPDVVILSGALAQTASLNVGPPWPGSGMNDMVFLQRMYDAGAAECFDVMAVNDYMLWSGPTDHRLLPLELNYSRPMFVRDVMVANGDAHKPIWISEMNANAVPNDPAIQGVGNYGMVSLEQQARYAPLAYQRALEEWPWVGVINFWFFKRPSDAERNQSWYYFRMVEPDFTPLPVYAAMRDYVSGLTPTVYPGFHQEEHWALVYSGAWETVDDPQASLGRYRRTSAPGASLTIGYDGGRLLLAPGPEQGQVSVVLDGRPAQTLTLVGQPVVLSRRTAPAAHTLTLTLVSGTLAVDSLVVERGVPAGRQFVSGAVILGGLGLLSALVRRRPAA